MAKPIYWILWVEGVPHKFTQRHVMRAFRAACKMAGKQVTVKAIGG